ncbi:MAG: HAMP domain-containing histidine kinase [Anaerolineae bacterium]|nr:HAMP domain-containing histidine kinase [Anaerolineae bacterium]
MADETSLSIAFEVLFNSINNGVVITGPDGLITQMNPALAGVLSVALRECLGQKPAAAFAKRHGLVDLLTKKGEQERQIMLPKRRLAVGIGMDLPDGGRIAVVQDITEKEDLDSRREALVDAIAHDLKNTIGAISGFADLVAKMGDMNEQQERFLKRVRETANHLDDVILPLVDLAWIEAGMPLRHEPCRLGILIHRAVGELSNLAREKAITIAISTQEPMPVVMGDSERLQQVVYNLLHNAIIYAPPEVTVAVHAYQQGPEVICTVADPGPGIKADELDLIFTRMYRSSDESVRGVPGNGLGLTLARTVVQRHGGAIWAESEYGRGSTFTFVLPSARLDEFG